LSPGKCLRPLRPATSSTSSATLPNQRGGVEREILGRNETCPLCRFGRKILNTIHRGLLHFLEQTCIFINNFHQREGTIDLNDKYLRAEWGEQPRQR
jgi:hypothetical protein